MGRKSKLTPERQKLFVDAVSAGNYIETAAELAGVTNVTFYNWMKRGRQTQSGKYFEFLNAIKKAEARAEVMRVSRIAKAGQEGNWQADAWYLERRYPDRWGRRQRLEHTGKNGGPIIVTEIIIGGDED